MRGGNKKGSLEPLALEIGKKQCWGTGQGMGPVCLPDIAKVFLGAATGPVLVSSMAVLFLTLTPPWKRVSLPLSPGNVFAVIPDLEICLGFGCW